MRRQVPDCRTPNGIARGLRRVTPPCALLLCAAILGTAPSCSGDGESGEDSTRVEEGSAESRAYSKTFGDGPVRLTLRLDKTTASLAERLHLEQVLTISPGFESEFPEYLPEDFDGFAVVSIDYPDGPVPARLGENEDETKNEDAATSADAAPLSDRRRYRKRLTLEPDRSGELSIAPLATWFNEAGEDAEVEILTEEIPVTIEGLAGVGDLEVSEPGAVVPSDSLEATDPRLLFGLASVGVALLVSLGAWLLTRGPKRAPPPTPPHEIAWESLHRLVAQKFVERGEVELFFVHLSAILRHYIEGRFEVHAPERTTSEFLEEAREAPALGPYRERLVEFLRRSDQVKFAQFQPESEAIQESFDLVKQFVEETTPDASS